MKNRNKMWKALAMALLLLLVVGQAGCSMLKSGIHDLHGSIFGNEYNIDIFDNMGIRTLRSHGEKIDIDNMVGEKTYSSDSDGWFVTISTGPTYRSSTWACWLKADKNQYG